MLQIPKFLARIPTRGEGLPAMRGKQAVGNGDKEEPNRRFSSGLPSLAILPSRFSKTGHALKQLRIGEMRRLSTFHATTITTTSNSLSYIVLFLEAVPRP
jgi:hypothetical protein